MKIAVISEVSAVEKNKDIIDALNSFDHTIMNVGMKNANDMPELSYIETGFLGGALLNSGRVDMVVGGCGTGQGFLNSVMQYPNVFAGLIQEPLDTWLFGQINGGNCISLALNKGYGWAGDINLRFIFERLFSVEIGCGYPEHRKIPQGKSREVLAGLSRSFHLPFSQIINLIPDDIFQKAITFPGVIEILDIPHLRNDDIQASFTGKCSQLNISL